MSEIIKHVNPGMVLLLSKKQICGTWLLIHGKSCAIVETPPKIAASKIASPAELVSNYLVEHGIRPIYITITHHHWDHVDGIQEYQELLKKFMPFDWICHESVINVQSKLRTYFNVIFNKPILELSVEGEPLYLIHAPKHCESDVLIIFRGAMITGDWWLEAGDPNPNNIPPNTSIESINRILDFLKQRSYWVHSLFSVHGNDFRYHQDVQKVLEITRDFHQSKLNLSNP